MKIKWCSPEAQEIESALSYSRKNPFQSDFSGDEVYAAAHKLTKNELVVLSYDLFSNYRTVAYERNKLKTENELLNARIDALEFAIKNGR